MSGILASLGSALGSASVGVAGNAAGGLFSSWLGNSSKESLNKNITRTNLKYQKQYDLWTQQQDKAYNKWWQEYLYDLQANDYYALSKKYATNTAKWAVDGLKAAGLNPILAAGNYNMSSNTGNASPSMSPVSSTAKGGVHGASVSGGGFSPPVNLSALSQIQSTAKNNERTDAETENIKADTDLKKAGGTEFGKNLIAVGTLLDDLGLKKPLKDMAVGASKWMMNNLGIASEGGSSAKQQISHERHPADDPNYPDAHFRTNSEKGKWVQEQIESLSKGSPREQERARRLRNAQDVRRRIFQREDYHHAQPYL
nr:pilot protein for DNA ejection [Microvirus sp.]